MHTKQSAPVGAVTEISNSIIDEYLRRLSGGALACLVYLHRIQSEDSPVSEAEAQEFSGATGYPVPVVEQYLSELQRHGLASCRVTLPGDRVVYWLTTGEE